MVSMPEVVDRYRAEEVDGFLADGHWGSATLSDLVDARAGELGEATFITDATTAISFSELRAASIRLAAGLRRSGVAPGDRVAVQLPNWTEFAVVVAAISRCGAVVVPIMPIYRRDEVAYVLSDSGAVAAITCERFNGFDHGAMFGTLAREHPDLRHVFLARSGPDGDDDGGEGPAPLEGLAAEGPLDALLDELGPPPGPDAPHLIVYTSGTTSRPKGCVHTFNTLGFTVRTMASKLGFTSDDVAFGPSPVTHATGYVTSVLIPLFAGSGSHVMEAWNPTEALERIGQHRCSTAVTATVFLKTLTDAFDPAVHDATSLRVWVCAGSPIPASVIEAATAAFGDLEVLSLYGRSENMTSTMCSLGDDPKLSLTSDGRAPEGVEIQIVDEDGAPLPPGHEGDIAYRGPGHMLAYLGQPELTAELFTDQGFSRSGDLGVMTEDGYVRVTGRIKDIIIRGGMNISAREIEELLLQHPLVDDVAIVAVPDDRLGEQACACIVPAAGAELTLSDLTDYLRTEHQLAVQKLPEHIHLTDALPMTATGKVQKHLLRDRVVGEG